MVRVFAEGLGDLDVIPGRVIPKAQKWYLMPPCLTHSFIRYVSRVSGSIQGKYYRPLLHLGVVAIEKGAFRSPSTTVGLLTIYMKSHCINKSLANQSWH